MGTETQPQQASFAADVTGRELQKVVRLSPEENERLAAMIQLAAELRCISEPTLQAFLIFSLNCAAMQVTEALHRSGRT